MRQYEAQRRQQRGAGAAGGSATTASAPFAGGSSPGVSAIIVKPAKRALLRAMVSASHAASRGSSRLDAVVGRCRMMCPLVGVAPLGVPLGLAPQGQ